MSTRRGLVVKPVIPDQWEVLVPLFGKSGAHQGCWCNKG
jgi:hypothetical protein